MGLVPRAEKHKCGGGEHLRDRDDFMPDVEKVKYNRRTHVGFLAADKIHGYPTLYEEGGWQ